MKALSFITAVLFVPFMFTHTNTKALRKEPECWVIEMSEQKKARRNRKC